MKRRQFLAAAAGTGIAGLAHAFDPNRLPLAQAAARAPDVMHLPTPNKVVDRMLEMARVGARDVVYDLGCGDGRIVITAAKRYGARGVGVDIDPARIQEASANARAAGVSGQVKFVQADLFEVDISPATVVTLYLLTSLNLKIKPRLLQELRPGTRVVSHAFDMGNWKPEREDYIDGSNIYLWRVPSPNA